MNLVSMKRLSGQLAQVMIEDPHNGAEGYCVRSLYFDTLRDTDYEEKLDGLELRRKIRLRIYAPGDSFAMLEMKQKQGSRQKKAISARLARGRRRADAGAGTTACCAIPIPSRRSATA